MNQSEGDDSQTKRTSSPELNEKQSQISEQLENPQFSVQEPLSEYKTEYILIENKITNGISLSNFQYFKNITFFFLFYLSSLT